MQRADFEKNVHQKMQELRFRPSEECGIVLKRALHLKASHAGSGMDNFADCSLAEDHIIYSTNHLIRTNWRSPRHRSIYSGKQADNEKQSKKAIDKSPNTASVL
jgi:hypothetical protein